MTALRSLLTVAHHELRIMSADRSLWLLGALLAGLCAYATYNGVAQTRARDQAIATSLAEERQAAEALRARLARVMSRAEAPTPWDNPTDPSNVGYKALRYAVLPTTPLAPLAVGQSDMYPDTYAISTKSRVDFMYDSEIENPWSLWMGRFDLAFVFTYLLPLFVFAWSYNVLSLEREQGTLRLLLSQPVSLYAVVAAKLTVRLLVLLGASLLVPLAALLAARPEARGEQGLVSLASWVGLTLAYTLFWFALTVLIESFSRSSALNALICVSSWVVLVLVVPISLNLVADRVSPSPSRAELATQTRLIAMANLEELKSRWGTDYEHVRDPERLLPKNGRFEVPERMRAFELASARLDTRIDGALRAFDQQLAGQQAFVERFGILSPAIVVNEGLAAIAGNGTRRFMAFQQRVTDFHGAWKARFLPRVLDGIAITDADLVSLPRWTWEDDSSEGAASARHWLPLFVLSLALMTLAWWRLRRYRVI